MKINKFAMAAALGLGIAGVCNAGTVYLTGSTAMRGIVYNAIEAPGVVFTAAPATTVYQGGTTGNNAGSGANYMAFSGTLVGGSGTTVIQCHWTGSEGGIGDVASNTVVQNTFMDPSLMDGTDHGTNSPALTVSDYVNLAMADNAQSFSRTKKPTLTTGSEVGVITFKFVRNKGLWTGSNVTDSQIRQALGGLCPLAVFSGNAADTTSYVYVSGRDNQSGTRVNAYGDTSFGIFSTPVQIEMNSSGVMQQVNGSYGGDFGYSSGGTLAGTMGANTTAATDSLNGGTGYSVIAYLSVGDAATAITAGATELSYDGITFSPAAVKEGTYTFWGNEYIYQANNVVGGSEANNIYKLLSATTGINAYCDGTKAIKLTDMHCTRTGPTSDPSHN
jgi:hypothetical protein